MGWVKLDDTFAEHPKVEMAGDEAAWLYVCGLLYAYRADTNGFVPAAKVSKLTGLRNPRRLAEKLVEVRLWETVEDGFLIHDYLKHQQSSQEREEHRLSGARRVALHRDKPLRDRVRERDGNCCRYCGEEVIWTDRRSSRGGTYDHVDPKGGNSESNLVVACRGCNAKKGARTPEKAGMPLLPVSRYDLNPDLEPDLVVLKAEGEVDREGEELPNSRSGGSSVSAVPHPLGASNVVGIDRATTSGDAA